MTTTEAPIDRTQLPLSAVAKHLVMPTGIVSTDWPGLYNRTIRKKLGVRFDGWQQGAGRVLLSKRENGRLATTVGGFGMSIPRQVGKTFFMTPTLFALSIERPNMLSLWSAHHSGTSDETFLYMQGFCQQPRVRPFIADVYTGSGDEAVVFVNGSRILFGARERGWGRGIPNVDAEVFDEAQILSPRAMENMLAAMNRSKFGLHVYLGTPPKEGDASDSFADMRDEALAFKKAMALPDADPDAQLDLSWIECGADDDAPIDIDDPEFWDQVPRANPSYPVHTAAESVLRLRKKLGPDGFRREGFGIWPGNTRTVFDLVGWVSLEDRKAAAPKRAALVVHVGEYRKQSAIAVAGEVGGGAVMLLVMCGEGMDWVPGKISDLVTERSITEIALAPGEAKGLMGDLAKLGVKYKTLSGTDIAASCTAFQSAVKASAAAVARGGRPEVVHGGQRELDGAVARAKTRRMGEAETWEGAGSELVAAAAAFHRWKLDSKPMPAFY